MAHAVYATRSVLWRRGATNDDAKIVVKKNAVPPAGQCRWNRLACRNCRRVNNGATSDSSFPCNPESGRNMSETELTIGRNPPRALPVFFRRLVRRRRDRRFLSVVWFAMAARDVRRRNREASSRLVCYILLYGFGAHAESSRAVLEEAIDDN